MTHADMVYKEVYKGCKAAGCIELIAKDTATSTLQKYKNNQFTKVSALIKTAISEAKKLNKAKRK
ncbi:MAG: hypothetical protein HRU18_14255 [Pseudoalteromonas sp.]|uniref:hypothetical protein n=1 Tax=Pseudoalteromonas sp. TaxID=53249 RepID=UPI001DEFBDB2|nr:hypothetical protein [Pseudoalteromonas sp.]NRA79366.1 hypothetical protein [Pseudoalteromonas sp.]